MSESMPSCYQIFRYWENRRITEKGEVVLIPDDYEGIGVVDNEYVPACWACGRPVKHEDYLSWDKYNQKIEDIWKDKKVNSYLNRCHIMAKQFDGSNDPDNLFLLCETCHKLSPDTKNREAFLRWVYRRKQEYFIGYNLKEGLSEFVSEIVNRGYNLEDFAGFFWALPVEKRGEIEEKAFRACGLHGGHVAVSSAIISFVNIVEQEFLNSCRA